MFFQKPAFGIDISDYSIEIVSLGGSVESPKLLAMGRKVLEPGISIQESILGKEMLRKGLKDLLQNLKFGKLNSSKVSSAIPESKSYVRAFALPPDLDKKAVLEYVKSQAKENFPHPIEDLYFDFQIRGSNVLLAASPRRIVDDYLEVFQDCGLEPVALEIESLSLGRALIPGNGKENILIADLGARTTNFSLFCEEELKLSFSAPQAGDDFTRAFSDGQGIPLAEAEKLKEEIGLGESGAFSALEKEVRPIAEGVKTARNYFQDKIGEDVKRIILAGGSSVLPGLAGYLASNLGLAVEIGDPWVKINIDILKKGEYLKEALEISPVLYSTVIGAALRGLAKDPGKAGINLLPAKGR